MIYKFAAAKRVRRTPRRPSSPVTVERVSPAAMQVALALAGGDPGRIKILSPSAVLVTNQPRGAQS